MAKIPTAISISNYRIPKLIQKIHKFHNLLLLKPLLWEGGYIIVLDAPGLRVELNKGLARAHPHKRHLLHLEMSQYHCNLRTDHEFAKS